MIAITGKGFTVTVTLEVLEHPFASVPTVTYVVVDNGSAETLAPVVEDKPLAGDHT